MEKINLVEHLGEKTGDMSKKMFESRIKGSLTKKKKDTIVETDGETDGETTDVEEMEDDATISAGNSASVSELESTEEMVEETAEAIYKEIAESGKTMERKFSSLVGFPPSNETHEIVTPQEQEWRDTLAEYNEKKAHVANGTWIITPADSIHPTIEERHAAGMVRLRKKRDKCLARARRHHEEEARCEARAAQFGRQHFSLRDDGEELEEWMDRVRKERLRRSVPVPFKPRTSSYPKGYNAAGPINPVMPSTAADLSLAVPRTSSYLKAKEAKETVEADIAAKADGELDAASEGH